MDCESFPVSVCLDDKLDALALLLAIPPQQDPRRALHESHELLSSRGRRRWRSLVQASVASMGHLLSSVYSEDTPGPELVTAKWCARGLTKKELQIFGEETVVTIVE